MTVLMVSPESDPSKDKLVITEIDEQGNYNDLREGFSNLLEVMQAVYECSDRPYNGKVEAAKAIAYRFIMAKDGLLTHDAVEMIVRKAKEAPTCQVEDVDNRIKLAGYESMTCMEFLGRIGHPDYVQG